MLQKLLYAITVLFSVVSLAQVRGKVTDEKGNPLPFVNIFEENTYNGTTTNEQGRFEINIKTPGNHTLLF